ncbi:MAG: NPCBM/NEW2 domain-containing protein [Myxococcales bacterium]|nr:NPCBM/NEW2 domain-containing protein [Myxococcales bacterium]
MANAWGPVEKDRSNGGQLAGDGRVLTINGATYAKGLGVTARAEVTVPLGGAYRTFTSDVGIDDEVGLTGSAVFVVVVDGVERYRSATLTGASAKVAVAVDITGAQTLRLIVEPTADGGFNDYADWAGAMVTANATPPPGPRYVSDLAWVPVANAWGPVEKDRSNGGQLAGDGRVLTINGATYAKGLGVTARAEVTVPLGGAYRTFTSDVGIDDEVGLTGSAVFVVVVDGVERYRSAT